MQMDVARKLNSHGLAATSGAGTNEGARHVPPVIWEPSAEAIERATVTRFMCWLATERGVHASGYDELWRWSVDCLEDFWAAVWRFFDGHAAAPPRAVLSDRTMPGARWFEGAELSYAEHALRFAADERTAILRVREDEPEEEITWRALREAVGALGGAAGDRRRAGGSRRRLPPEHTRGGDRDARGHQPRSRMGGLRAGSRHSERDRPVRPARAQGADRGGHLSLPRTRSRSPACRARAACGTATLARTIVCLDLQPDDTYFFFSSTSWMAWNYLVGGLLHGSTIVLCEGSPSHPRVDGLWERASRAGTTVLGMGSAYVTACQKAGAEIGTGYDLAPLRTVIPTGAPLPINGWRWLAEQLPRHTRIDSICGGTDVCTAFIGGSPLLPVHEGEIGCRWLGIAADTYGADGRSLVGEVGEFVMTEPMPSMPVALWNDPDGRRYHDAYFDTFPGVWRQVDWVTISDPGTLIVSGRSDATLNRGGVRIGSAEIYGAVERLPEVLDSLIVGIEQSDGGYFMPLFVVPADPKHDPAELRTLVIDAIRSQLSPRHVPDEIMIAPDIPRTLTGKKLEVPVKRIFGGAPVESVAAAGAVDKPDALCWFERYGRSRMGVPR